MIGKIIIFGMAGILANCASVPNKKVIKPNEKVIKPNVIKDAEAGTTVWQHKVYPLQKHFLSPGILSSIHETDLVSDDSTGLIIAPQIHNGLVIANTTNGFVSVLHIRTGKLLLHFKVNDLFITGASQDNKNIYLTNYKGQVYAINKATLKPAWKSAKKKLVSSTPKSNEKLVFIRTKNGEIIALNQQGKKVWSYKHRVGVVGIAGDSAPVVYKNKLLFGTSAGEVVSLNANTGEPSWVEPITFEHGSTIMSRIVDINATPLIENDFLYSVSINGSLVKFKTKTGLLVWEQNYSSDQSPVIFGSSVIVSHEDGFLDAFNKNTGAKLWRNTDFSGESIVGPVIFGNMVAISIDSSKNIFWLDANTGKVLQKTTLKTKKIVSLRASASGVLAYTKDGELSLHRPIN